MRRTFSGEWGTPFFHRFEKFKFVGRGFFDVFDVYDRFEKTENRPPIDLKA
jgi:hypothetical protein